MQNDDQVPIIMVPWYKVWNMRKIVACSN